MAQFDDPFEGLKRLREVRDSDAGGLGALPGQPQVQTFGQPNGGGGGGGLPTITTAPGGNVKQEALKWAQKYGWTGAEWNALDKLITKESSWNPAAQNPTSTAWGLFQFLDMHWGPGRYLPKGRSSNLADQLSGGFRYIKDRYGSPSKALAFHLRNNWY